MNSYIEMVKYTLSDLDEMNSKEILEGINDVVDGYNRILAKREADEAIGYKEALVDLRKKLLETWLEEYGHLNGEEERNGYFVMGFVGDVIDKLRK